MVHVPESIRNVIDAKSILKAPAGSAKTQPPIGQSILPAAGNIFGLGTQVLSLLQLNKVHKINLERAKKGLPPIDASDAGVAAQADVNIRFDKGLKNVLIYGGVAVGAILLISMMGKK